MEITLEAVDAEECSDVITGVVETATDALSSQTYKFDGGELVFFPERDLGYVWDGHKLRQYMHYHPNGVLRKFLVDFSDMFDGPDMMPVEYEDYPSDDRE